MKMKREEIRMILLASALLSGRFLPRRRNRIVSLTSAVVLSDCFLPEERYQNVFITSGIYIQILCGRRRYLKLDEGK